MIVRQISQLFFMADLFPCSGLNAFFSNRFRKYQVFIEVTSDRQTLQMILSFLDLKDLLAFLSTSSHFRSMQKMQSVQVRLLRAKLQYYQRPKPILAYSGLLLTHFYRLPEDTSQMQTKMVKSHNELVKFNREVRFFKYLKREGLVKNQQSFNNMLEKKGFDQFGKFYDEFHKEDAKLGNNFSEGKIKEHKWSDLQEKEMEYFKQYKDFLQNKEVRKPAVQSKAGKKLVQYKGTATGLNPIEYLDAKRDYQLRKAAREVQLVTMEKTRESAHMDPCSKEVFQKLSEGNKAKIQQQNVAKLRMAPVQKLKEVDLQLIVNSRDVKVIKQSIAGKMFTGLKDMIFSRFPTN